jgi:hypothetical protein
VTTAKRQPTSDRRDDLAVDDTLERVRTICGRLPECTVEGGQHHTIAVRGKTMAWHTVDHHGDGRVALHVRMGRGENEALVATDGEAYFLPAYVARHGYVGVYLDRPDVDWDEVDELLVEAYRLVAPATLRRQLPD